jgi:hypothetical protein
MVQGYYSAGVSGLYPRRLVPDLETWTRAGRRGLAELVSPPLESLCASLRIGLRTEGYRALMGDAIHIHVTPGPALGPDPVVATDERAAAPAMTGRIAVVLAVAAFLVVVAVARG